MSTILDALRKLEEERHSRTADARSRLLLSPSHQAHFQQRQRSPWKAKRNLFSVIGFLLAGFVGGASLVLWRSYSERTSPYTAIASSTVKDNANVHKTASTQEAPGEKQATEQIDLADKSAKEQVQETPPLGQEALTTASPPSAMQQNSASLEGTVAETASSELGDSASSLAVLDIPSPPSLPHTQDVEADFSAVQHSPFAAAPPPPREPTPTQQANKQAAKRAPAPPSSAPNNSQQGGSSYKVLMPDGATRSVAAPELSPSIESASPTPTGTSLSFLQWSNDPERRIAFLRVNGGPLTMAHEGDTVGGYLVIEIRQNEVELQSGETRMTLRP